MPCRSPRDEAARLTRIRDDLLLLARSDEDRLSLRPRAAASARCSCAARTRPYRLAEAALECRRSTSRPGTVHHQSDRIRQAVDDLHRQRAAPSPATAVGGRNSPRPAVQPSRSAAPIPGRAFRPSSSRAFEQFRRPGTGPVPRANEGAGLGLAIVQAIAVGRGDQSGSRSPYSSGAVVILRLPGVAVHAEERPADAETFYNLAEPSDPITSSKAGHHRLRGSRTLRLAPSGSPSGSAAPSGFCDPGRVHQARAHGLPGQDLGDRHAGGSQCNSAFEPPIGLMLLVRFARDPQVHRVPGHYRLLAHGGLAVAIIVGGFGLLAILGTAMGAYWRRARPTARPATWRSSIGARWTVTHGCRRRH